MRTRDDIFTQVLVRNNRTTTDSFITDTILKAWFKDAHEWASSHRKWPFTEGRASTTWATEETPVFEGWKSDSTRFIQVGGYRYQKLNFEDYQIFREEQPNSDERVFSDFARTYFINPNSTAGTLVAYGQYTPYIDVTDETGITIFSDFDEEGNEAIVEKMTSYLKRREHLAEEAELHDNRAVAKLEAVWDKISKEQFAYHSNDRGMFKRLDVLGGNYYDDLIKRDQF